MIAGNERILVIDDDRDIRDIIRLVLELEGFKVDELDSGHFVDETILSFKPQLILLDVMLGDMDGRQICRDLKKTIQNTGYSYYYNICHSRLKASFRSALWCRRLYKQAI